LLALNNLLKKYQISAAQLIDLIKNRQLNSSGDKTDSSLVNSNTADQSIERNKSTTLRLSTSTSPTLKSASPSPASSTKIYSLESNKNKTESKIHFKYKIQSKYIFFLFIKIILFNYLGKKDKETKDVGNVKPTDREEGPDEDGNEKELDEDADKQLKDQQAQSDKDDYQSVDDNKEKPGLFR
jgi:hypothetical protein